MLGATALDQQSTAELEPLLAGSWDRLLLCFPLGIEPLLCRPQPCSPATAAGQVLGQFITTSLSVDLVLGRVDTAGLLEDLLGEMLVSADSSV